MGKREDKAAAKRAVAQAHRAANERYREAERQRKAYERSPEGKAAKAAEKKLAAAAKRRAAQEARLLAQAKKTTTERKKRGRWNQETADRVSGRAPVMFGDRVAVRVRKAKPKKPKVNPAVVARRAPRRRRADLIDVVMEAAGLVTVRSHTRRYPRKSAKKGKK